VDELRAFEDRKRRRAVLEDEADRLIQANRRELTRMSRAEYMRSVWWHVVREAALSRAGDRCEECGAADRLQAHHVTYERFRRELPEDVRILCDRCHRAIHEARPAGTVRDGDGLEYLAGEGDD